MIFFVKLGKFANVRHIFGRREWKANYLPGSNDLEIERTVIVPAKEMGDRLLPPPIRDRAWPSYTVIKAMFALPPPNIELVTSLQALLLHAQIRRPPERIGVNSVRCHPSHSGPVISVKGPFINEVLMTISPIFLIRISRNLSYSSVTFLSPLGPDVIYGWSPSSPVSK